MAHYTEEEHRIMAEWPTVTEQDLERVNDLFPHYIFFRKENLKGLGTARLWTSCCGRQETVPYLVRTETPAHRELLDHLEHKTPWTCPWCGRKVTMISLSKAGKRKGLRAEEEAVLLHSRDGALYADALWLCKAYATEEDLTAKPQYWVSSGYRFTQGEAMEIDHQLGEPWDITYERGKLGRKKLVQEPFKLGSISWYHYESYAILNREALTENPFFRYCGFFDRWQYRPDGPRGHFVHFYDFISYLTAYAIYPRQVEMLVKAELFRPVADLIYKRKTNAAVLCWEETDPRKAFGLDKRELRLFLTNHIPLEALEVRSYVQRHWGRRWELAFCADFCRLWADIDPMEVLKFLKEYRLAPLRFLRYADGVYGQESDDNVYYSDIFEAYLDYLTAAYYLGRCLEHSQVLWPERLFEAHDQAMEEWAVRQHEPVAGKTAFNGKTRREKYEFELDGLRIVFPVTAQAIKREGKVLDHCVGGYAERHIKGVLTILFLRRTENPSQPYVTIEMNGNQLVQIHGYRNEVGTGAKSPRQVHKEFLDTWLRWLRAGSPRNEDGTPKVPKRRKQVETDGQARTA